MKSGLDVAHVETVRVPVEGDGGCGGEEGREESHSDEDPDCVGSEGLCDVEHGEPEAANEPQDEEPGHVLQKEEPAAWAEQACVHEFVALGLGGEGVLVAGRPGPAPAATAMEKTDHWVVQLEGVAQDYHVAGAALLEDFRLDRGFLLAPQLGAEVRRVGLDAVSGHFSSLAHCCRDQEAQFLSH